MDKVRGFFLYVVVVAPALAAAAILSPFLRFCSEKTQDTALALPAAYMAVAISLRNRLRGVA